MAGRLASPLSRDAGLEGGALDGGGHALDDLPVEDAGDDVFKAQFAQGNAAGNGARSGLFMLSVIRVARTSNAPRKMPGKASTLLIWLA